MSIEPPPTPEAREATRRDTVLRIALPIAVLALGVLAWDMAVRLTDTPAYKIPSPGAVFTTLRDDWPILASSLLVTLTTTFEALGLAVIGGVSFDANGDPTRDPVSIYRISKMSRPTPHIPVSGLRLDRVIEADPALAEP